MRKCSDCKIEKEDKDFAFANKEAGKLQYRCRKCGAIRARSHYLRNKKQYNDRLKRDKKIRSDIVSQIKFDSGCFMCPESDPVALDFHHLSDKNFSISRMVRDRRDLELIKKEIAKCVVLCANCHRKLHAGVITLNKRLPS